MKSGETTLSQSGQLEQATWEEFSANPEKFGFPRFDQWKAKREKLLGASDEILSRADKGSELLAGQIKRHVYEIEGYRCRSLEEVERVAKSQGIDLKKLDYRPQLCQAGAGKYDIVVKFVSKSDREKRDDWK